MHAARAIVTLVGLSMATRPAGAADRAKQADGAADAVLNQAEVALRELRYEEANDLLERARRSGQNGPRALARLYRLQGVLGATLGDDEAAQGAFARWLVIDPGASLAEGTSPKIMRPFQTAAAKLDGATLKVGIQVAGDQSSLTLEVHSDPLAMVTGAQALYQGQAHVALAQAGRARVAIPVPRSARLQVVMAALDMYGNRLTEQELTLEPEAESQVPSPGAKASAMVQPKAPPPSPSSLVVAEAAPPTSGPRFHQAWLWGGVAVGLGVVGSYHGWQVILGQRELDRLNAASSNYSYLEARKVADRVQTDALIANTTLVLAGVCAVTAVLLWPKTPRAQGRLSGQLGPGQARVAWEWSW